MKQFPKVTIIWLAMGVFAVFVFAGCGKGNFTSSSSTDLNINGHRTITKTHDGITRRLETMTDIDFQDGHITKFAKGAAIKIEESGGSAPHQAELRENGGKLELWVNENGSFRKGSADDEAWRDRFLSDVDKK